MLQDEALVVPLPHLQASPRLCSAEGSRELRAAADEFEILIRCRLGIVQIEWEESKYVFFQFSRSDLALL